MRFEDTDIWKDSIRLAKEVYVLLKSFPDSERYGIISQMKRAVTSVSANFAEGYGRSSPKDKSHFYTMAYGSLLETKNFIYLSVELDFCKNDEINKLLLAIESLQKRINGLRRKLHES